MPIRKPCIGCGQLIARTATRCATCQSSHEAQRGSSAQRGYDSDWQRIRLVVLERDGYRCQIRRPHICLGLASSVDHVNPLARGGHRLDPANLQAACVPCNSAKRDRVAGGSTRHNPGRPRGRRPDDNGDNGVTFA